MKNVIVNGNIFNSKCDYLVNPVNSIGVMGAGLAKDFKDRYPYYCNKYNESVRKGKAQYSETIKGLINPVLSEKSSLNHGIIFFPTKIDFKQNSKLEYIEHSLKQTMDAIKNGYWKINSIAFPKVGCGLGKLQWSEVEPLFDKYLSDYKGYVEFYI